MSLEQLIDQNVTLRGTAIDDAACAIVEVDDLGRNVYLVELASWGDKNGKRVEVTGTLRYRQIGRDPTPASTGGGDRLDVHGMVGKRYVLEGARWTLVP
jgi:hypothetical protein